MVHMKQYHHLGGIPFGKTGYYPPWNEGFGTGPSNQLRTPDGSYGTASRAQWWHQMTMFMIQRNTNHCNAVVKLYLFQIYWYTVQCVTAEKHNTVWHAKTSLFLNIDKLKYDLRKEYTVILKSVKLVVHLQ